MIHRWRKKLLESDLSQEQLTDILVTALSEQLEFDAVQTGSSSIEITFVNGDKQTVSLDNFWRECLGSPPNQREEVVERHVRATVETVKLDPGKISPEQILPVIRDDGYVAQMKATGCEMVVRALVADLWVCYVADNPSTVAFIGESQRKKLGLSIEELDSKAMSNLCETISEFTFEGDGEYFMAVAGGNYESSILLMTSVWDEFKKKVDGNLIACVPARDMLLFTGSNSKSGLKKIKSLAKETLANGDHVISKTLLQWAGEKWIEFKPRGFFSWF